VHVWSTTLQGPHGPQALVAMEQSELLSPALIIDPESDIAILPVPES